MTTKLQAINTMLSCIGQSPINTLTGTKTTYVAMAENILDDETERVQLSGWRFNTREQYTLNPDDDGYINLGSDIIKVDVTGEKNTYVMNGSRLEDITDNTFVIKKQLKATVTFLHPYENLPRAVANFIKMSAANKFVKRVFGSQNAYAYTKEDMEEARVDLEEFELDTGNYSIIPEYTNGTIRKYI